MEANLKINADTADSRKNVAALADSLEGLGKTLGGEVGAQAEQAAAKLRSLGQQEAAIQSFQALRTEVGATQRTFKDLEREAGAYAKQITASGPPTAQETTHLAKLRAAADAAAVGLEKQRSAVSASAAELQRHGIASDSVGKALARVQSEIAQTTKEAAQLDPRVESLTKEFNGLESSTKAATADLKGLQATSEGLKSKLTGVAAAVTGLFAAAKLKDYALSAIETADAYGQMTERIKMATPVAADYAVVQKRILEAANLTYRPLKEQQTLYIETADALRELGYTTTQALDIQDSFTYLLTTNAASAEKGANAIDAYTKSINSGRVEVDAWQSILAATPTVIDSIAAATSKTTAEVRQLGITGKLSIADLNEGLRLSVDRNKQLAAGMSTTVKDSVTRLSNTWQTYIGEANKANHSTEQIVKMVDMLSSNLDGVVKAATIAGEVMVVVWAVKALGALKAYVVQLQAASTATVALMATTTTAGAKMALALSAAGKLAVAGWIGWEIGTFLRTEFEVVEKAGIALSANLTKGAAMVQGAWEMVQAAFSSDTIDAASARMELRLQEIDAIYADMFANAGKASQAQNNVAASTTAAGTAAENAKTKWEHYKSAFTTNSEALELQARQVEALVALRNAEADGIARVAQEMGTEKEARQAAADAATVQAEQAKTLAEQASKELSAVRSHRDELAALGAEMLKNDPIRQKQLDALNVEVKVRESAAGQAIAHARSLEVAAIAAHAESAAVSDNSARVKELGDEYEQTRRDLQLLRDLQALGLKTQQDVEAGENALIKASKEYKDALSDQVKAVQASQITRVSELQATVSMLETQKGLAAQSEQIAALMGNEVGVRRAKITQLEIDIKLTKAKAEVAKAEAEGTIAVAEATRAEMKAKGESNPVKEAEIDASIRSARAKMAEADAIRKSAEVTDRELTNLRNGANNAGNGISKSMDGARESVEGVGEAARDAAGSFDQMGQSAEAAGDKAKKARDEADKESGYTTRDNMDHASRSAGGLDWLGVWNDFKARGVDDDSARKMADEFFGPNGEVIYMNNPGMKKYGGSTASEARARAAEQYFRTGQDKIVKEEQEKKAAEEKKQKDAEAKSESSKSTASSTPSSGMAAGPTYVSHITLKGQTKTVKFADASSQAATEQLLQDLTNGKGVF